jgi:hypothetical protein
MQPAKLKLLKVEEIVENIKSWTLLMTVQRHALVVRYPENGQLITI